MPEQRPKPLLRQPMLALGDVDGQIVMPPCRKCGTRTVTRVPARMTADTDIFAEEFNARLGRTFVCAGCGIARAPRLEP